jgi:uncharacterized protein (DUF697 family)
MADKKADEPKQGPALKVKRERRRLYEEPASPRVDILEVDGSQVEDQPEVEVSVKSSRNTPTQLLDDAADIIGKYRNWAMGLGLVPIPLVDTVTIGSVQALMIKDLAKLYGVEYSLSKTQVLLASFLGASGPVFLAAGAWLSFIRFIPLVGTALGAATLPVLAGAATYAVGQVFQRHFQNGGTLEDMDAAAARDYFAQQLKKGKDIAGKAEKN